jgi:hypothetical protein
VVRATQAGSAAAGGGAAGAGRPAKKKAKKLVDINGDVIKVAFLHSRSPSICSTLLLSSPLWIASSAFRLAPWFASILLR